MLVCRDAAHQFSLVGMNLEVGATDARPEWLPILILDLADTSCPSPSWRATAAQRSTVSPSDSTHPVGATITDRSECANAAPHRGTPVRSEHAPEQRASVDAVSRRDHPSERKRAGRTLSPHPMSTTLAKVFAQKQRAIVVGGRGGSRRLHQRVALCRDRPPAAEAHDDGRGGTGAEARADQLRAAVEHIRRPAPDAANSPREHARGRG